MSYTTADSRHVPSSGVDPGTGHLGLITAGDAAFVNDVGGSYIKKVPTRMVRMSGPFKVLTGEGPVECEDGWLALDSNGNPYPIADDVQAATYSEVTELS